MAIIIRNSNPKNYKNGRSYAQLEIDCDTAEDLPTQDGVNGYFLLAGSTALIIDEPELCIMDSSGQWHDTSGSIRKVIK